jgi:Phage head-tail joining protein
MKSPSFGEMRWSIQIVRRSMVTPLPHEAQVDHDYLPVLTTRAHCRTRTGVTEFNRVVINGQTASHTFTIRYTTIPIDVRDRVRDTQKNLYQILSADPMNEGRQWLVLHCARVGSIERGVVR